MVLVQKWPFFQLFFLGNIREENVFYDILERKNAFLGYRDKKFKKTKNWHFSKGVNPWFWSKHGHFFQLFFLRNCNISQENVFYDIVERKNAFLGCKSKKFKKSKNWHISKKVNSYIWSKNGHFSNFFFWGNIKTRSLKSRKIDIFQSGLTHGFGPKIAIFPTFLFLGNIGQGNVFYDILKRKNAFLGY